MTHEDFIRFFHQAAPYIHLHRNKTFLIAFSGDINRPTLKKLLHDCALLHSLGIHLILVHGARAQIDAHLKRLGFDTEIVNGKRITCKAMMPTILDAVGSLRLRIEATLSMGMANSPMQDASVRVVGGNYLTARPVGVIDGLDYGFAGELRRIDTETIQQHLQQKEIVLISPLGYSPTGEIYNLNSEETAARIAAEIHADKLIYISDGIENYKKENRSRQLTPTQARHYSGNDCRLKENLTAAAIACESGIRRVHLLEREDPSCLLTELFTRDGAGIMITEDRYDNLRQANVNDIVGLLNLIRPLEDKGILVKRSRERLEAEIEHFFVLERDNTIIGCAALYPYPEEQAAELACMVIHPEYRRHQRADNLLEALEHKAKKEGIKKLFILTTHTAQWFAERGFEAIGIDALPIAKQHAYNYRRRSRTYLKIL